MCAKQKNNSQQSIKIKKILDETKQLSLSLKDRGYDLFVEHQFIPLIQITITLLEASLVENNAFFMRAVVRCIFSEAFLSFEHCLETINFYQKISTKDTDCGSLKNKILSSDISLNSAEKRMITRIKSGNSILTLCVSLMKKLNIEKQTIVQYKKFFDGLRILRNKSNHGAHKVSESEKQTLTENFGNKIAYDAPLGLEVVDLSICLDIFNKLEDFYRLLDSKKNQISALERRIL